MIEKGLSRLTRHTFFWPGIGFVVGVAGAVATFDLERTWVSFAWLLGWVLAGSWIRIQSMAWNDARGDEPLVLETQAAKSDSLWRDSMPILSCFICGYAISLSAAMVLDALSLTRHANSLMMHGSTIWFTFSQLWMMRRQRREIGV